ncbi:MAG: hypothetical protein AB7F59_10855 [Bdellovibrionales bacterium]
MSIIQDMQYKIKSSSSNLFVFSLKFFSGLFLGTVFAIIGHELMNYGSMAYWFVIVLTMAVFLRISKPWGAWGVVIFNLVCLLVGMLLRMYILISPGE